MRLILVTLALLIAGPAFAQDVTYRPTAGEFTVRVDVKPQPQGSVATQAVSVVRTDTDARLACAAAANDQVVEVIVSVPTAELPAPVIARSWENGDCTGQQTDSVNTGELQLGPPVAPELVP